MERGPGPMQWGTPTRPEVPWGLTGGGGTHLGSRHSPGVPALSWYQKARHWAGAEGWYGWDVSAAVCLAGREALPVLTTM